MGLCWEILKIYFLSLHPRIFFVSYWSKGRSIFKYEGCKIKMNRVLAFPWISPNVKPNAQNVTKNDGCGNTFAQAVNTYGTGYPTDIGRWKHYFRPLWLVKEKISKSKDKNKTTTMIVLALHKHNFSTSEENNIANVWPLNNNYTVFFSFSTPAKKS